MWESWTHSLGFLSLEQGWGLRIHFPSVSPGGAAAAATAGLGKHGVGLVNNHWLCSPLLFLPLQQVGYLRSNG